MKLAGKVAIVTGGASGIGRASAVLFAREGAKVIVADRELEGAEDTVKLIHEMNGVALAVKVDVVSEPDVERMVQTVVAEFGTVDILFNNAGVEQLNYATHELPLEEWNRVVSINLTGVFLGSKHVIREMLRNGGGVIINTSSIAGMVGFPDLTAYCASKAGVVNLTRQMAMEYAKQNIRVNCICPGYIKTDMIRRTLKEAPGRKTTYAPPPIERMGQAEEIAEAALFLASNSSSYVTGIALPVDGGCLAQ